MKIEFYPYSKILLQTATPVEDFNSVLLEQVVDMIQLMSKENGLGLAAPQVGISKRFFVIKKENGLVRSFINPTITKRYGKRSSQREGCLSVPGYTFSIDRFNIVDVDYYNLNGEKITESFTGIESRKIQHEHDHLDGWLIPFYNIPVRDREYFTKRFQRSMEILTLSDVIR